jgi:hypothetical protein
MSKRISRWSFLSSWLGAFSLSNARGAEPQAPAEKPKDEDLLHGVNWELLNFSYGTERKIERVILTFGNYGGMGGIGPIQFEMEFTDSKSLALIENAFEFSYIRIPSKDTSYFGDASDAKFHICTNKDEFDVYFSGNLILEKWCSDSFSCFYSWTLAKFLDDVRFANLGKRYPAKFIERASGERRINGERKEYAELIKEVTLVKQKPK